MNTDNTRSFGSKRVQSFQCNMDEENGRASIPLDRADSKSHVGIEQPSKKRCRLEEEPIQQNVIREVSLEDLGHREDNGHQDDPDRIAKGPSE